MEFNENFIEVEAGDITKKWQSIYAYNILTARMIPELIDGLKPVVRRALYMMYQKDGGRSFRKVLAISGDTIGKVHPHCLHGDTEFMLTNGTTAKISELYASTSKSFEILAYDMRTNSVVRRQMHDVRITKYVSSATKVTMTNGAHVTCTDDHKFLVMRITGKHKTYSGRDLPSPVWVEAKDLRKGDMIYSGEISNLSLNGEDVGYPEIYLPYGGIRANNGGRSEVLHRYLIPIHKREGYEVHHANYNKNDFSTKNLMILSPEDHIRIHLEDPNHIDTLNEKLDMARDKLRTDPDLIHKMRERNSKYMKEVNQRLPLFKAFKTLREMEEAGAEFTEESYNNFRKRQYNTSSLDVLFIKGFIIAPVISALLEAYKEYKASTDYMGLMGERTPRYQGSVKDNKAKHQGSLKSSFIKSYSRILSIGGDILDPKSYEIYSHHKSSKSVNLWKRCTDNGIDIDDLLNDLKYKFIQVESVGDISFEDEIPMYDFTVDKMKNAAIICGHKDTTSHSFIIVHNSDVSVQSAIVGNAQWWNNSVPLIEGSGNFGSCYDKDTEVLVLNYPDNPTSITWVKWEDFYDNHEGCLVGSVNIETGEWKWETPTNFVKYRLDEKYADEPEKQRMVMGIPSGKGGAPSGSRDSSGGGQTGMSAMSGAPFDDPTLNNPIDLGETPPAPAGANKFIDFMVTEDHNLVLKSVNPAPEEDKFEFHEAKEDGLPDVFKFMCKNVHMPDTAQGFGEHKILPNSNMEEYGMWEEGKEYKEPDDLVWVVNALGKKDFPFEWLLKLVAGFLVCGVITDGKIVFSKEIDWGKMTDIFEFEDDGSTADDALVGFLLGLGEPVFVPPEEDEEETDESEEEDDEPIYDKFIPSNIFNMNRENMETFLNLYAGIAQCSPTTIKVATEPLAFQFQALTLMTSKFTTAISELDPDNENEAIAAASGGYYYQINCIQDFEPVLSVKDNIRTVEYTDEVYCAEMPKNHTMVTRHNGVTMIAGNCSGDCAGAPRYIKARLSDYAIACFFEDWKDSVVDMQLAYDEETMMPDYLPAKYPNVLINGCLGIAYGFSVRIPSFNFREVIEATIMLIHNPNSNIILIPDSPTGADIIEADFGSICNRGKGSYMQRCKYSIDPESNTITITALPEQSTANSVRETIANIKEKGGLTELLAMNDLSGAEINIQLVIRDDVNPYKFMKKLISQVAGLEQSYPVSVMVTTDYMIFEYSIKQVLLEWLKWRREQKRVALSNKRGTLYGEQRVNDIKLFIMNPKNLNDTLDIFRHSHNRQEIEDKLIAKYRKTEIMMDSVQARALSNMRMIELTIDAYEEYKKRAEEIKNELAEIEEVLNTENGVDKVIIAELRDGIKRFGKPRRSNVVPYTISVSNEVDGYCILQLSSDGNIIRTPASNAEEEPIPTDSNGFACLVDNDASFILVDDMGYHTFIRVKELPVNTEVPVFRYSKKPLDGKVVAMLPYDIESDKCCTLISKQGIVKRIRIPEIGPSKKPIITIDKEDRIVKGIVLKSKSQKDLLIYTKNGMGQRLDPNSIRITSPSAKGISGFKLKKDDEICGVYSISPEANAYLLYVTTKGKARLNLIDYLPTRESKHDDMVQLITLNDRDKLVAVVGCNKLDKATVYYDDSDSEVIDIKKLPESTMSSDPKKVTQKNAVSNNITKVKIN